MFLGHFAVGFASKRLALWAFWFDRHRQVLPAGGPAAPGDASAGSR